MNIEKANTEPYFRFVRFLEEFDRSIKVTYGALQLVKDNANKLETTNLSVGCEPWGKQTLWKNIPKHITSSTRFISQLGLVSTFSAFEDYLSGVRDEILRFQSFSKEAQLKTLSTKDESTPESPLTKFCSEIGFDLHELDHITPLHNYITEIRNCVVHRSGRASKGLIKIAESPELAKCIDSWKGKALPPLPELKLGKSIELMPRHAIMASIIFSMIAKCINKFTLSILGENGLIYMAAHHGLLSEDLVQTGAINTPERFINNMLFVRYKVTDHKRDQTPNLLKKIGVWKECRRAHAEILKKASQRGQSVSC